MKSKPKTPPRKKGGPDTTKTIFGSQTLTRGLDVVKAVATGSVNLSGLAKTLNLNRSTAHRIAATLVAKRYLNFTVHAGYALGPKLLELAYMARYQKNFPFIARDYIEALAAETGDTVHLGVLDDNRALYLDRIPGSRRVEIRSRIGDRQPLRATGIGKALILDLDEARWRELYELENREGQPYSVPLDAWLKRMRKYAKAGYALDLEEQEDRIRCVAAPVRDAAGTIIGAISVSSASQYMDDVRMAALAEDVRVTANAISRNLGWAG